MNSGDSGATQPDQSHSAWERDSRERSASGSKPCLGLIDKQKLESLFEMNGGYVFDLSNQHLADLVQETTGRDLYADDYAEWGNSKAKRLRSFWVRESPQLIGRLIHGLLDYYRYANPTGGDVQLLAECEQIASRLFGENASGTSDSDNARQHINTEFQFEAGTVTLATGEVFSPTQHAVARWYLKTRPEHEAYGNGVDLLYQTADDQFIRVKADITPPDFYSENIHHAAIMNHDDVRVWLQRLNFMLPDCLMEGVKTFPSVPPKTPKPTEIVAATAPDTAPPAVKIDNWAEGSKAIVEAFKAAPTDPPDSDDVQKPDGLTRAGLIAQAKQFDAQCSPSTFDSIRGAAGIPPAEKGGAGAQRRFSAAQIRKLIDAAETGKYRSGRDIAAAWRQLLPKSKLGES